jgi:predicted ATPase
MNGMRWIDSVYLQNVLSFGSDGVEIDLQPLNVIVGANGSGKSNFLEAFRLFEAAPRDLTQPILRGGGIDEWIWKGETKRRTATVKSFATVYGNAINARLEHKLSFVSAGERLRIESESIYDRAPELAEPFESYVCSNGQAYINALVELPASDV